MVKPISPSYNRTILHEDDPMYRGMRKRLVKELARKGITDERVLDAIGKVKRHFMIDLEFANWAYKDIAFPIEANQTISMPYTVALQSQLLDIQDCEKVLEVGTGSGYQAAVLHEMGAKVYSIERQRALFEKTSRMLMKTGYQSIRTLYGDGYLGAERFALFDKIIVTAGAKRFPDRLLTQLKIGGIMVIPMESSDGQQMMRYVKTAEGSCRRENHGPCAFVPMLSGVNQ
ncbi:MAG: protein-L-isoaspartate(D-aspartate) O-methyltransferase [Bacteroidota bacterium]